MPRIPGHTVDTAPEESQEALRRLEKRFGKVLNIHGEMAHSPGVPAAYTAMSAAIAEHGTFCSYCQVLVKVVREIADDVGEVSDTTWDGAIAAGWTGEQLTEAFAHVSVNLYTNYLNHYVRTDLDIPAAPPLAG